MSREIKFRVKTMWCDEARVAPVSSIDDMDHMHGYCYIELSSYSSDHHGWDTTCGDVLMQYTGIKDKNDVEIYEGDIVSFMFLKTKVERKRGVVVFDVDELCYFIRTSSEWGYNHNLAWCDTEVIGNIYENPELLEAINEQGND